MLGRDHALLGATAFLAGAPVLSRAMADPLSLGEIAVGTFVCAGFALLPDIDEPGSSISRKLGPISEGVSAVTKRISGGHRHATHSLLFVALVGLGCWYGVKESPWAAFGIVAAAMLLVARLILPLGIGRSGLLVAALAVGAAYWAKSANDVGYWLPACAAAGVLMHLVGDFLTREGVPLLWPFKFRFAFPVIGHTQSTREMIVGGCLSVAVVVLAFFVLVEPLSREHAGIGSQLPSIAHVTTPNVSLP